MVEKKKNFNTTIDAELLDRFKQRCKENKIGMNEVVESFMEEYCNNHYRIERKVVTEFTRLEN